MVLDGSFNWLVHVHSCFTFLYAVPFNIFVDLQCLFIDCNFAGC
jgi:hypothetical protein